MMFIPQLTIRVLLFHGLGFSMLFNLNVFSVLDECLSMEEEFLSLLCFCSCWLITPCRT